MCGHAEKRQCSGKLHQDNSAPPGCLVGVPPQIKAEVRGASKLPYGVAGVFRVSKVEGARHGLKAKRVSPHPTV